MRGAAAPWAGSHRPPRAPAPSLKLPGRTQHRSQASRQIPSPCHGMEHIPPVPTRSQRGRHGAGCRQGPGELLTSSNRSMARYGAPLSVTKPANAMPSSTLVRKSSSVSPRCPRKAACNREMQSCQQHVGLPQHPHPPGELLGAGLQGATSSQSGYLGKNGMFLRCCCGQSSRMSRVQAILYRTQLLHVIIL